MSESMQQAPQSLERMRQWHEQYRAGLVPSPLEDINQLGAKLDLTHAHPSGIAQLFAGGRASLDLLFRDNGMLRAANRRLERVLDEKAAKLRVSGVAELSLTVGVATWDDGAMPVLLYPVSVQSAQDEGDVAVIRFVGHVRLNPAFVTVMREQHVELDERELLNGAKYDIGTPMFIIIVPSGGFRGLSSITCGATESVCGTGILSCRVSINRILPANMGLR